MSAPEKIDTQQSLSYQAYTLHLLMQPKPDPFDGVALIDIDQNTSSIAREARPTTGDRVWNNTQVLAEIPIASRTLKHSTHSRKARRPWRTRPPLRRSPSPSQHDLIDLLAEDDNPDQRSTRSVPPTLRFNWSRDVAFKPVNVNPLLRRAVLLTDIPANTGLSKLLNQLACKTIIFATYCKTAGMLTQPKLTTDSAIIGFIEASQANDFVQAINKGEDQSVKAAVIPTPSRPLPMRLVEDIERKTVSRKLLLQDESIAAVGTSVLELNGLVMPIKTTVTHTAVVLEFASVLAATKARTMLFYNDTRKINAEHYFD